MKKFLEKYKYWALLTVVVIIILALGTASTHKVDIGTVADWASAAATTAAVLVALWPMIWKPTPRVVYRVKDVPRINRNGVTVNTPGLFVGNLTNSTGIYILESARGMLDDGTRFDYSPDIDRSFYVLPLQQDFEYVQDVWSAVPSQYNTSEKISNRMERRKWKSAELTFKEKYSQKESKLRLIPNDLRIDVDF